MYAWWSSDKIESLGVRAGLQLLVLWRHSVAVDPEGAEHAEAVEVVGDGEQRPRHLPRRQHLVQPVEHLLPQLLRLHPSMKQQLVVPDQANRNAHAETRLAYITDDSRLSAFDVLPSSRQDQPAAVDQLQYVYMPQLVAIINGKLINHMMRVVLLVESMSR